MASPFLARTLEIAMFLMITLDMLLTKLQMSVLHVEVSRYDSQSEPSKTRARVLANDAGVASNLHLVRRLGDGTIYNNNFLVCSRDRCCELSVGRDCRGCAASTTCGATILRSISSSRLRY